MTLTRRATALVASLALAAGAALVAAPPGTAAAKNRSLAKVLTSDGNRFDHNSRDYDIVTEAVLAVLKAKPSSPVSVLTKGSTRVTAFIPNDQAFRVLAYDVTGKWITRESNVFKTIASLPIDTIETVLLYHVVAGKTIYAGKVLRSDGASLTTAQGGAITVDIINPRTGLVRLQDLDPNSVDPFTVPKALNINRGNKQIAHGISYVLRPAAL